MSISKAQQEFMGQVSQKLFGGFKSGDMYYIYGGRSQDKSYFQDVFLQGESPAPINYDWIVVDEWKRKWFSNCILMKTSSKQPRHIRVWRNK